MPKVLLPREMIMGIAKNPPAYFYDVIENLMVKQMTIPVLTHKGKWMYFMGRASDFMKNAMKIYIPAHFVIMLLRLRSRKDPKATILKKYLIGVFRSSIFVTFFALSIPSFRTFPFMLKLISPQTRSWGGFIISFLFSWGIFLETSTRWADLALYVTGQWIEGFGNSLVKRKLIHPIRHGEKLLLALAIGFMIWLRFSDVHTPQDEGTKKSKTEKKIEGVVDFLVGDLTFKSMKA